MLILSRTGIRNLATDDTVYSRGLQYYKSGRVSNVVYSKTSHQYRMMVRGNYSYSVIVTENEDGSFSGVLKDVIETGANDVYTILCGDGKEVLIPAIKECILSEKKKKRSLAEKIKAVLERIRKFFQNIWYTLTGICALRCVRAEADTSYPALRSSLAREPPSAPIII